MNEEPVKEVPVAKRDDSAPAGIVIALVVIALAWAFFRVHTSSYESGYQTGKKEGYYDGVNTTKMIYQQYEIDRLREKK